MYFPKISNSKFTLFFSFFCVRLVFLRVCEMMETSIQFLLKLDMVREIPSMEMEPL